MSLFTRTPIGLTPTGGAQRLIEHVEAMDLAAQTFNRMASSEASVDHDTIRLTCGELLGIEVDVWVAMHNDLRKVKRIVQVFEALGEQLRQYLCLADQ